uniref:MAK10-like protein n=1 Tax=Tanacetum cinerariifolium TaxID=118510 RepID=A0A6L2N2F4_TANCI|nr:hypothetical protein [Tanacetum cinerariifolium]
MGDENPIRTLGDYSKPSHKGYRNTIELPVGNNVAPLRFDTIRLLKELTTSRAPKKVLIREEAKIPVTKNVNFISLIRGEEEISKNTDIMTGEDIEKPTKIEKEMPVKDAEKEDEAENEPNRKARKEETTRAPSSQRVEYYLKHRINKKLIEGLVYNCRKEDIKGNFKIPYNIGGLKHMNALVNQGFGINVMPLSTYMKLTDERPAETDIRLFLASHSYIYPLGIAEDILVEVAEHVYPMDFVILDIKENKTRPFILGTPFLTTTKAVIKFDKGTITLRSEKSNISFHRIPESFCKDKKGIKNDIEPIAPTMTVNRLVLEWEEKIKHHQEKEMEFNR